MFSKLSYTIGASLIALATIEEVQAVKTDSVGTIKNELGCAQCIKQSGTYFYGVGSTGGTFAETSGNYAGKCCTSTSDTDCTGAAKYSKGPNSSIFTEKEYAINACPNKTTICKDRTIFLRDTTSTAVERAITALTYEDSCQYMVKTFCGVPQIKLKAISNVDETKVSLNFLEWAPDGVKDYGTTKIAAQALERGKKFMPPDGESSPLLSQTFKEKTDPQKLQPGTIPLLGTKNVTAVAAAIATQRKLLDTYKADLTKYYTAYQAYADSFIAILKENWNDYGMNVMRSEADGNFYKKNLTAAAVVPTEPAAFTGDYLKTSTTGDLSPAWEAGAGSPTKGSMVLDKTYGVAGALKNFGVFGQGSTGTGYYSNWRSELWHYGMNNDQAAAQKYGADICPPKYMFLNVVYINNVETGTAPSVV